MSTNEYTTVRHISRGFSEEEQEEIRRTLHNLFVKPEPPELIKAVRITADRLPETDLFVTVATGNFRTKAKPLANNTWIALVQDTIDAERVCAAFITATEETAQ